MEPILFDLVLEQRPDRSRSHRYKHGQAAQDRLEDGFICKHCHAFVTTAPFLSGVQNRNHCPYCLWSRHVDLHAAGDRLCACKSPMQPVGLTAKAVNKKYAARSGELMLVHLCTECESLSINRIAADDIPETIFGIYGSSDKLEPSLQKRLANEGIHLLQEKDSETVQAQLFGQRIQ
jgi:hypothetical protein